MGFHIFSVTNNGSHSLKTVSLITYSWLNKNGFKTFNNYWKHIDAENLGAHDTVYRVIEFLQTKDLYSMYVDMLPDLRYNKQRFYEFSKEQEYKMENIFENY